MFIIKSFSTAQKKEKSFRFFLLLLSRSRRRAVIVVVGSRVYGTHTGRDNEISLFTANRDNEN